MNIGEGKVVRSTQLMYLSCSLLLRDLPKLFHMFSLYLFFAFTLIPYDSSQVFEMLTIVANLVTKFECVVFGSYIHILCCTLLHAWSNSTPMVSISSYSCSISNLLSKAWCRT